MKVLKKVKLFTWIKTSLFLSAFCGLLSVGFFVKDKTKYVEKVAADGEVSQLFTIVDTGNIDSSVNYILNVGTNYEDTITLSFTYRYELFGLRANDVVNYKERVYLTYNECRSARWSSTYGNFVIVPYDPDVLPGHETMTFETPFMTDIPDDASFYLMCIQDLDSSRGNFNATYDISSTIQGDYWETWTINSMLLSPNSRINITNTWYARIDFPYSNGTNRVLLFDATSTINSVNKEDIWYSQGYSEGYLNGYGEGYFAGQESTSDNSYSEGYSVGAYNGYQLGYADGVASQQQQHNQVYQGGYNAGYADGYSQGHNADSTASTIFNGILSVALVPINFFLAIFNFEILGINLSSFIKALLTVCLTIIVIRTVMGGKGGTD